ncbi:MAG: hypothetical protein JJT96_11765 [Opitutales bacterium]|nr:hypothetical protein [Opitutales bacterium]
MKSNFLSLLKRLGWVNVLLAVSLCPLFGLEEPTVIASPDLLTQEPYNFTGYLRVNNPSGSRGIASAVVVDEGVIMTAAHVVFDPDSMSWVTGLRVVPRHHQRFISSDFSRDAFLFVNILRFDAYQARVQRDFDDGLDEGVSSFDTFNLDIAVAARNARLDPRPMVAGGRHPEVGVDPERPESWLRTPFPKKVLGYPSNPEAIPEANQGLMHEIPPDNYLFFWEAPTSPTSAHFDSGGFWLALYDTLDFRVFTGNSGGPVFVYDEDLERWIVSAVVAGGSSSSSLVRAVDTATWDLIETAAGLSGVRRLRRITDFTAQTAESGDRIDLTWVNPSTEAEAVAVLRNAGRGWVEIARVAIPQISFTDRDVEPGSLYLYSLQPVSTIGNRAPRSDFLRVPTPGTHPRFGARVGSPFLSWTTGGDAAFVEDGEGLRSGRVPSLGHSSFSTVVTGPGELRFRWSVSSERNLDLPASGSAIPAGSRSLYDSFFFLLNGEEAAWISGSVSNEWRSFALPEGTHTLQWEYRKDPYADEGEDAGFLHEVIWDEQSGSPIFGAFETGGGFRFANWWGTFAEIGDGWSFHTDLGWLFQSTAAGGFWSYAASSGLGWFFTAPELYPYVYSADRTAWLLHLREARAGAGAVAFRDLATSETLFFGP